jgi:hypothetical protein
VDPNSARHVLRISPETPLTVELVERAFAGESWARHPSRYQDASARGQAEEWARTLATAREVLLAQTRSPVARAAAVVERPPRRRLSWGAIVGIVSGSVAVLTLITFVVIGVATIATNALEDAGELIPLDGEGVWPGGIDIADVERYQSGETMYTFSSALEVYNDYRYSGQCSSEYVQGCWQMALFPDTDCDAMEIELAFTNDADPIAPEHTEVVERTGVKGNEATVMVFGNDEYDYGWISQVTCLDPTS